jgi:hypothetical protein
LKNSERYSKEINLRPAVVAWETRQHAFSKSPRDLRAKISSNGHAVGSEFVIGKAGQQEAPKQP